MMVKISDDASPLTRSATSIPSASDSSAPKASLQMISVSSTRGVVSPRKRGMSQVDTPSSVKPSPLKKEATPVEISSPLTITASSQKLTSAVNGGSPCKKVKALDFSLLLSSPQKRSMRQMIMSESSPKKSASMSNCDSPQKMSDKLVSPSKAGRSKVSSPAKRDAKSEVKACMDPVAEIQRVLRCRISQLNCPPSIFGYERERKQLYDLIKRTAVTGESNSMLLIGPRGCGKSMLIRDVVDDLYREERIKQDMMLVKLNGLLQSDDRIALREITRQLQLENTVGDRVFGSFAETLQFLLEALKKGDQSSKPTLFVLEEFDLFAQHKNQTLLYNLFDISQSAQAPICVIGITCRLDVVELLEKRVKSRFSHRQIHLFNSLSLAQYRRLCLEYLSLPPDFPHTRMLQEWNANIETLLDEVAVKDVLERQFNLMNDVRGLLSLLTYPVCNISQTHPTITASDIITSFKLISTDTKSAMLHGVSVLELAIIIAMKHLTDIYEGEPFNFEMVYSEYLKFARHKSGMQVYEKAIVMKAYEHLQTLELIRAQGGTGGGQKEYRLMSLLVHPAQILDALQKYPNCPTEIRQWATQSIS